MERIIAKYIFAFAVRVWLLAYSGSCTPLCLFPSSLCTCLQRLLIELEKQSAQIDWSFRYFENMDEYHSHPIQRLLDVQSLSKYLKMSIYYNKNTQRHRTARVCISPCGDDAKTASQTTKIVDWILLFSTWDGCIVAWWITWFIFFFGDRGRKGRASEGGMRRPRSNTFIEYMYIVYAIQQ